MNLLLPFARRGHWEAANTAGLHRATAPLLSRAQVRLIHYAARVQRPGMPLLGPAAPTVDDPAGLLESGPLYAGEGVARIHDIRPAADIVTELAGP